MTHGTTLVESVATALTSAIEDPDGPPWKSSPSELSSSSKKRPRCAEDFRQAAKVFDSVAVPPIAIDKYLARLSKRFQCSDASFIAALVVVDRLLEHDEGRIPLTNQNVHRVFLAALVVSVKYHEDLVYNNCHYAKAGGVHLREVNRLEHAVVTTLNFDLRVTAEQYAVYKAQLEALHQPRLSQDAPVDEGMLSVTQPRSSALPTTVVPCPASLVTAEKEGADVQGSESARQTQEARRSFATSVERHTKERISVAPSSRHSLGGTVPSTGRQQSSGGTVPWRGDPSAATLAAAWAAAEWRGESSSEYQQSSDSGMSHPYSGGSVQMISPDKASGGGGGVTTRARGEGNPTDFIVVCRSGGRSKAPPSAHR